MESLGHWSYEETQALIGVWSEDKIQQDLEESFRNEKVYREVSERLAAIGMSRSAKQCRDKIKKLKEEYRKIKKESERSGAVRKTSRWYNAMDAVMSNRPGTTDQSDTMILEFMISDVETDSSTITDIPGGCAMPGQSDDPQESGFYSIKVETDCDGPSTSTAVTSTAVQTTVKDTLCCWSHKEVQALLTLWANPAIQQELLLKVRNNKVYNCLSAQMESLGFNKTPKKCREKIKKLKQEYKRIKNGHHMGGSSSVWFAIMDEVLSSHGEAADCSETAELSFAEPSVHAQLDVWDVNTSDEAQWSSDEVQVLMTLWAQHNIQKQLLTSETINQVFTYLSNELALIGFNKTPHQCRLKVDNLKAEYKRIKQVEPHREIKSDWFAILDSVIGPGPELSAPLTEPKSGDERSNDTSHSMWSSEEVKVLLTCWAEESVQEELRTTPRNERVFAHLSSELAMQGFNKTTSQCRSKIRVLKQKYKKVKEQKDLQKQKSRWFTIMDGVLRRCSPEADAELAAKVTDSDPDTLQVSSQQDLNEPARGCHLSFSSLCLLVPTLRLMSAFAWQVIQCCNVAHYRKVEELLKVVTEMIPELLTPREKVQLLLRLRARLVLEFCVSESTANLLNIQPHLKVIQGLTISSSCDREVLEELENSKSNFVEVVHTLLEDPEERQRFFKEVFPIYYGQQFEVTLQALVWKFLSRLDNLLPIPDIKQTAEWLSSSPSLMEECGEMVLDPDQLKEVLHFHQKQTGSINTCLFQPQNMFLPLLSLHPKSNSKQPFSKEASTGGEEEAQLDYEDEEPVEEHRADDNEVLKIKEEEESDEYLQLQTCSMCPYSDSQVSGLLQHIRAEHLTQEFSHLPSKEPGKEGVFQTYSTHTPEKGITAKICEYCGKVFKNVSSLNRHVKRHTLSFHCDKCDKKYTSKDSLNVHRRIHTGETPYLCSHCGQGFRSSYTLALHVRIHTGERRYKCHICGKTSIQHLARHMRMHRGEKNYLCTVCGKAFLSSGELKLHMRFHTGERPYTCKYCGRGFIAKCLLTVHTRQHTGERPYKCSLCPKSFHILRAQKRHMMIHSNKKSFQCLICGKIFRQEDTFKMHVETHKSKQVSNCGFESENSLARQ